MCSVWRMAWLFTTAKEAKQQKENTKSYSVKITTMNTCGNYQMIAARHFIQRRIHYDYLHLSINSSSIHDWVHLLAKWHQHSTISAGCGTVHISSLCLCVPHCCKLNRCSHRHFSSYRERSAYVCSRFIEQNSILCRWKLNIYKWRVNHLILWLHSNH